MELVAGEPSRIGLEAFSVLRAAAQRAAGPLADQLAERALRVTERGDFAVAQDALDALLRRLAAAQDAGSILRRPRRRALGWYLVGRREPGAHHYDVLLTSLDPVEGSCSCPDFAKASLGVCKHLFLVTTGRAVQSERPAPMPASDHPLLCWDPVRPLVGAGDWLERVSWFEGRRQLTPRQERVRRLFRAGGQDRPALAAAALADPTARLAAVAAMLEMVRAGEHQADPAVPPLLAHERQLLARMVRHPIAPREMARHLDGLKQKLFLYQREGVRRFLERGRLLLADDMGLGKTAQAIAACHVLVASGRVRRGLIVVPAPLKAQWLREWPLFTDLPLTAVEGAPERRMRRAGRAVLLVTDEQLGGDLPQLLGFRPELVVLDEAQRIKNWAGRTSTYVKRLEAPWRLVLTGTPMESCLDELASIMEWVDEAAMEPRWRLASWHTAAGDGRGGTARNLDTLRQRLAPSMVRRIRREVLEQLPSRRDTRLSVSLTQAQRAAHDQLDQPIARIAAQARWRPLSQPEFLRLMALLTRQRIICNGIAQSEFLEVWPSIEKRRPTPALLASLSSPKLGELRELVAAIAIAQDRKVVVFSQWRRMLRLAAWALSDLLPVAGLRAVSFTGEESARQRSQNLVDFHDDPEVRILFATDAGGVGLDLQRAATACIHLDLPWNPAMLEQRTGRIHRLGQSQPVDAYTLVAEDGIEGRIGDKQALFSGLFDGSSDTIEFERAGSFLSRLEAVVIGPGAPGAVESPDGEAGAEDVGPHEEVANDDDGDHVPASVQVPDSVASLFSQIQVTQLADGRVSFEAPAPAAAALADLLQGVARILSP